MNPSLLFLFAVVLSFASGEVQLLCPPPLNLSGSEYTELTAGPRTIIFQETNARPGSPFRLSIYRANQECVILDHIPYQSTTNNMYYVTVDIPNVRCLPQQNCALVLRQIDTSSGYCQYSDCPQYNSTVPVSIRSSGVNSFTCPSRRKPYQIYNWPYDPSRRYQATLRGSSTSARAVGMFVLVGETLLYNITMTSPFSTRQAEKLRFLYYPIADRADILGMVNIDGSMTSNAGSWTGISSMVAHLLTTGVLYVDIVTSTSSDGDILGQITVTNSNVRNPVDNLYGLEHGNYSSSGWFTGNPFTGPSANATVFAKPTGPCLNTTRYFGCILNNIAGNGGGTVGLSITGNRVVFGMDMFDMTSTISSVTLQGQAIDSNNLVLTSYWHDGYRVNGIVDITDIQRDRILDGLSSVRISTTNNRNGELQCDLQEGMIGLFDSNSEVPPVDTPTNGSATSYAYISVDGVVTFQTTLNDLTSPLVKAHVHGPAYQGRTTSNIPLDMSRNITRKRGSSWNVLAKWQNITADELRYFIEGLIYLNMHTVNNSNGELRAQLSIPGQWFCPSSGKLTNQCYWPRISLVDGVRVDSTLQPYGVGAVVIDRVQRLQYSLAFWNIPDSVTLTVRLVSPEETLNTITVSTAQNSNTRANVREISFVYPDNYNTNISEVVLSHAQQGNLAFNVTTPTYVNGYLYGMLPPLERNKCAQDYYIIPVGGTNGWSQGQDYFPLRLLKNDRLNFTFSSPNTVHLMANINRYIGCVFGPTTSTLLSNTPGTYIYIANMPGNYYFASMPACEGNQPMKFPIYVVESVSNPLDSQTCTKSLYSYTVDQRLSSSSSSEVLAATMAGLVFGILIVVIAIVIAVLLIVKRSSSDANKDLP